MSKSVMRSCKPYWVYLIIIGKKRIEVGKDYPKSPDWNKVVELYCSNDKKSFDRIPEKDRERMKKYLGKVALRFRADDIRKFPIDLRTARGLLTDSYLTAKELDEYRGYKDAYGWNISDLVIYDKPKKLGEFWHYTNKITRWLKAEKMYETERILTPVTMPPMSWFYVEA